MKPKFISETGVKDPISRISKLLTAAYLLFASVVVFSFLILFIHYKPAFLKQDNKEQTSFLQPPSMETGLLPGSKSDEIKYGYQLIMNTSQLIGPLAKSRASRYAGNNLSCSNCHLQAGKKRGSGSFVGVTNRYPQFSGRENKEGAIEDRINGCMERSMNGKPLPANSPEMQAMVAYMEWLGKEVPEETQQLYQGYAKLDLPQERADPLKGRHFYDLKCRLCHGEGGKGQLIPGDTFAGYLYPPLGGNDSYNDGAGMNRIITAAEFIKGNMPFGATYDAPLVTDEEAYHIAAYINSLSRPSKANKEADFPDTKLKPVSTPYGPYADDFSSDQHKFGPFQPIIAFYQEKHGIIKKK